ncbi:MAG: hypothetical protein QOI91_1129 [Solirubrobacteraceae bacterium]|jgi:tyrosinase|nr:hypothetical protein [Solirubrobacteraceae bacterium]
MARYHSKSLEVPPHDPEAPYTRADLIFYGVDHRGPSYIGRVFLDNKAADETTPLVPESGYAGSFTVFGHNGCAGDEGHCDVPEGPRDPFDLRPPHPLEPLTQTVNVTDALRRITKKNVTVTVVPVEPAPKPKLSDALAFDSVRLTTYD